jgi:hypothetical protein
MMAFANAKSPGMAIGAGAPDPAARTCLVDGAVPIPRTSRSVPRLTPAVAAPAVSLEPLDLHSRKQDVRCEPVAGKPAERRRTVSGEARNAATSRVVRRQSPRAPNWGELLGDYRIPLALTSAQTMRVEFTRRFRSRGRVLEK